MFFLASSSSSLLSWLEGDFILLQRERESSSELALPIRFGLRTSEQRFSSCVYRRETDIGSIRIVSNVKWPFSSSSLLLFFHPLSPILSLSIRIQTSELQPFPYFPIRIPGRVPHFRTDPPSPPPPPSLLRTATATRSNFSAGVFTTMRHTAVVVVRQCADDEQEKSNSFSPSPKGMGRVASVEWCTQDSDACLRTAQPFVSILQQQLYSTRTAASIRADYIRRRSLWNLSSRRTPPILLPLDRYVGGGRREAVVDLRWSQRV